MKYDFAMVVGRFQPVHVVHEQLIQHALSLGNKVIIVLGSSHTKPDPKNPFTAPLREKMIRTCFSESENERLVFSYVRDYPYNENLWIAEIQNIANAYLEESESSMALVGHFKDASSYYLNQFPQWKLEQHTATGNLHGFKLNATDVRKLYFETNGFKDGECGDKPNLPRELNISKGVESIMREFAETNDFKALAQEHRYIEQYKKDSKFVGLPYAPTFVTTDVLVTALGHALIIRRRHQPGKGTLALVGGFLAEGLTLKENAIKELKEETSIKVPKQILESNIVASEVFDHPDRSLRGRTITHAFHIVLNPNLEDGLPHVKGGDDAAKAFWMPIADLRLKEDEFFEDHLSVIQKFLGF